jgi:glycine/D-amino acid oxidase-like deaminating enzyme
MRVVICGGGVIGACMAYFLSQRRADVTVVERTEVAAAASGKAGGFLALDWCAGTPLDALARRSFELHATLAHEIGNDWGRRGMTAYSGLIVADSDSRRKPSRLRWLAEGVVVASRLSTPATTAIVHPLKFTSGMMRAAQRNGATLQLGRVTGIVRDTHEMTARGVQMDGSVLEADAVVIAMGPWSLLASEWMSLPAVYGQRSPSIVHNTGADVKGKCKKCLATDFVPSWEFTNKLAIHESATFSFRINFFSFTSCHALLHHKRIAVIGPPLLMKWCHAEAAAIGDDIANPLRL